MKGSLSHIRLLLLSFVISFYACSQDSTLPRVVLNQQRLGQTYIAVQHTSYKKALPVLFVHLHHNEKTAAGIADSISRVTGIEFLQVLNSEKRILDFTIHERTYRVDPNRIFSRNGAVASLNRFGGASEEALTAIDSFAFFLKRFFEGAKTIVALHNNTDGDFSLDEYEQINAGTVFRNPAHDPDDFFITTDSLLFTKLQKQGFNVVLEDVTKVADDGSLSVYCAKNRIRYVNVEAQHGHFREQRHMVEMLLKILEE